MHNGPFKNLRNPKKLTGNCSPKILLVGLFMAPIGSLMGLKGLKNLLKSIKGAVKRYQENPLKTVGAQRDSNFFSLKIMTRS